MKATVVCDYLSAVESVSLGVGSTSAGGSGIVEDIDGALPVYLNYAGDPQKYSYAFGLGDVTYGVGTVRGEVKSTGYVLLQHSSPFLFQLERLFKSTTMEMKSDAGTQYVMLTGSGNTKRYKFDKSYLQETLLLTYMSGTLNTVFSEDAFFKQRMFTVCKADKPHGVVRVSYSYTYEGKTYASAYSEPKNFYYDATDLGVAPTGVTTDKSHIVVS